MGSIGSLTTQMPRRSLSSTARRRQQSEMSQRDAGIQTTGFEINAAPPIDFTKDTAGEAARLLPASPSYFTTSPLYNDYLLRLTHMVQRYEKLPTVPADKAPPILYLNMMGFRSMIGEKVGSARYTRIVTLLKRLNLINPRLRPASVQAALDDFRRPGSAVPILPKPKFIDEFGRAKGVGRRKSATARVQLIEGNGEVMVNGKSLSSVFPRLHDRESVVWPLKITNRLDKYNAFIVSSGGGSTGQAESITLGVANALIVHEPALKPILRRGKMAPTILRCIRANFRSWLRDTQHEACGT